VDEPDILDQLAADHLPPQRLWSGEDLAYLAGFIDGEGTITVYKVSGQNGLIYNALLAAASNSRAVLDWVQKAFGGSIYALKKTGNREDGFQWMLKEKDELIALLPKLIPFLKIKELQARFLLKYCQEFKGAHRGAPVSAEDHELRMAYCTIFADLNARGKNSTAVKDAAARLVASNGISLP
jgi:hypothetical protein